MLKESKDLPEKHLLVPPVKPTAETILYNYMCMIGMRFERRLCRERKRKRRLKVGGGEKEKQNQMKVIGGGHDSALLVKLDNSKT
jgi:hypothetical protein